MSTYPWKKYFFPKTGHDSEAFQILEKSFRKFSWVITRIYEISIKNIFLEKVSGKSPESFPESLPIWVKLGRFNDKEILKLMRPRVSNNFFSLLWTFSKNPTCCEMREDHFILMFLFPNMFSWRAFWTFFLHSIDVYCSNFIVIIKIELWRYRWPRSTHIELFLNWTFDCFMYQILIRTYIEVKWVIINDSIFMRSKFQNKVCDVCQLIVCDVCHT